MTKGEKAQARAVQILLAAGFVAAGETPTQSYRTGSSSNPIYGGIGGKICTTGGRQRFVSTKTALRVTVGKVSTCFYEVVNGEAKNFVNVPTKEEGRIKFFATGQLAKGKECTMDAKTPDSLVEHQSKYKDGAWRNYDIAELGGIVAFFVKRAGHRSDPDKRIKDLTDAQNYLDMIQAHVTAAKGV